jgi:hypothetical protein
MSVAEFGGFLNDARSSQRTDIAQREGEVENATNGPHPLQQEGSLFDHLVAPNAPAGWPDGCRQGLPPIKALMHQLNAW